MSHHVSIKHKTLAFGIPIVLRRLCSFQLCFACTFRWCLCPGHGFKSQCIYPQPTYWNTQPVFPTSDISLKLSPKDKRVQVFFRGFEVEFFYSPFPRENKFFLFVFRVICTCPSKSLPPTQLYIIPRFLSLLTLSLSKRICTVNKTFPETFQIKKTI